MKIPYVTDQQLDKVLDKAASPVVVTFLGSPDRDRNAFWRWRMSEIAKDWDDRLIFCHLSVVENPEISVRLHAIRDEADLLDLPQIRIFLRGEVFGISLDCSRLVLEELFNRVMKVRR